MPNAKKRIRKAIKPVRKFIKRANNARLSFKRKHPRAYKAAKLAANYAAGSLADYAGVGAEYQAAKGLYRAYKGRNVGGMYNHANNLYTVGRVAYSAYKRGGTYSGIY